MSGKQTETADLSSDVAEKVIGSFLTQIEKEHFKQFSCSRDPRAGLSC